MADFFYKQSIYLKKFKQLKTKKREIFFLSISPFFGFNFMKEAISKFSLDIIKGCDFDDYMLTQKTCISKQYIYCQLNGSSFIFSFSLAWLHVQLTLAS